MLTIVILGKTLSVHLQQIVSELGYHPIFHQSAAAAKSDLESANLAVALFDDEFGEELDGSLGMLQNILGSTGKRFVILSENRDRARIERAIGLGAADYCVKPLHPRELIFRLNAVIHRKPRVVCIGGGTGLFTILSGLKKLSHLLLTAVVSMADDGGSSGRLRASFGILPPGDVRKCLVALSNAPELMNHVMHFRFDRGETLMGHNIGNLILTALSEMTGSMSGAVKALGDILNIQGLVMCATDERTRLCAGFDTGETVRGERSIDVGEGRAPDSKIVKLWHEPAAPCDPDAYASILVADLVILGPGDLFTSVIANLALGGLSDAIARSRGRKVYVCNLMTKPGETGSYSAGDHIREIVRFLGRDCLDTVLVSKTQISSEGIAKYSQLGQSPVVVESDDELKEITHARIERADIGDAAELVRHDPLKLAHEIRRILLSVGYVASGNSLRAPAMEGA